ncbi:MAG: CBS domain-containing protein [Desulfobacterales bacterium]|nr:CBS domain-containing protein [Desulfobacterales bacterium]
MKLTARDIMVKDFETISQDAPVEEAVKLILKGKIRETGYKTVSVMVTDKMGNLAGVLSMFDVLYHLRPPILNSFRDSFNFSEQELESYIKRFKGLTVSQVMNSPVRYVSPDTELMVIIDRMVKEKSRRLPVVDKSKLIGVVYLAEVFSHLSKNWLKIDYVS